MINVRPVILCGGSGTRLWPLSRAGFPKQFLSLAGDETLFQQAARRLMAVNGDSIAVEPLYVVCNEEHRFLAQEQLREIQVQPGALLLEPIGRNTAAALTLAALAAIEQGGDPVLVAIPADQTMADDAAFAAALENAVASAATGAITILGIEPSRPETGYGYIKTESLTLEHDAYDVERFVEKPDLATAQTYLDAGGYYWNAGMFVLKASVWLKALEQLRPDIWQATTAAWQGRRQDQAFVRPDKLNFEQIPAESIDYAVIERCPGKLPIKMVPLNAGWSDLGAWDAVWDTHAKHAEDNVFNGDVVSTGSAGNLVHAHSRLVSLVGVNNLVVIETADAVMVADKARSQDVKLVVQQLNEQGRDEPNLHRRVHRPWGWYDSIDQEERFKVKRICVNPGASLSLQKHQHRAEHWIVVKGEAEIVRGTDVMQLSENQSTYIPRGEIHRLSNPGSEPLEIIEVQSGDYLGEDDIIRLEDTYGRVQ